MGLSPATPGQSHASQVASIKLDADDLTPIVLDQNGARVPMPTKHSGPVTLPAGTVPSYVAYTVDGDDSVPQGFPAVYTGAAKPGKTTGPLRLDAVVQGKLDQDLAQHGKVAVHTPNGTYLVKPLASVFGSNAVGGSSTGQAWLATTQAAASQSSSSTAPATNAQAQTLTPPAASTKTTAPTTYGPNFVVRDLQNLLRLQSGKFSNLNSQALDRLKRDLGLSQPKNVATHPAVQHPTKTAAQMLDPAQSTAGAAQPAPIPEPSTLAFFGLVLGSWGVRHGLSLKRRKLA